MRLKVLDRRVLQLCLLMGLPMSWPLSAAPVEYPEANLPELSLLLDQARAKAPALVEQALSQEESVERLKAAKASYYPRLDLGANLGFSRDVYTNGDYPDEDRFGLGYNARVTRPLYHWGAIEAKIRQAKLDFDNESLEQVFILRRIKRSLRADYLTLLLNKASIQNLRLRRQIAEDGIARTQSDRASGTVSTLAAEQADLDLIQNLIDIEQLEAEQTRIFADYQRNLGWSAPLSLVDAVPSPDPVAVLAWTEKVRTDGQDAWLLDQSEVKRRQNLVEREKEELIRVTATQRPLLGFAASAGLSQRNTAAANNVETLSFFIGLDVTWNIFDGFETSARKRETLLRQRRLERQLDAFRAELRFQSTNIVTEIAFAARQLTLAQRRGDLAAQNLAVQSRDAKEGRTSPQTYRQQELTHNEIQFAALRSRVQLLLALNDYLDLTLPAAVDLPRS